MKFVNKIIVDAYNQGASDIHIEPLPGKDKTGIRFRIDGTLLPYIEVPAHFRQALVTRLKIMCDLDISEKRKPQDGKIKFKKFGPLDIELRVATIPIGRRRRRRRDADPGGRRADPARQAGPDCRTTWSGSKDASASPTACSSSAARPARARRPRCTRCWSSSTRRTPRSGPRRTRSKSRRRACARCQINKKAGIDFALVMRAFLRADPDIIMVGEMRDKETVSMGIEASLTGHLVFSTLHTNSAPESIIRLLDMGMDPFNFADALLGILAQRLAKRLCDCKEAYAPDARGAAQPSSPSTRRTCATRRPGRPIHGGEAQKLFEGWVESYGARRPAAASTAPSAATSATRPATRAASACTNCWWPTTTSRS